MNENPKHTENPNDTISVTSSISSPSEESINFDVVEYKVLHTPKSKEWGDTRTTFFTLPEKEAWHVFVTSTVVVTYVIVVFHIFCIPVYNLPFLLIYAFCDVVYLFDLLLNIAHRVWKKLKQKFQLKPKSTVLLCIDAVSLIPQVEIFAAIWGYNNPVTYYIRFLLFLRLYRLFDLIAEILGSLRKNRWSWFLCQYVVLVTITLHTTTCVWCHLTSYEREDITSIREFLEIWYMRSAHVAITLMTNTAFGVNEMQNRGQIIYCIVLMILGFLTAAVYVTILTVQFVNVNYRQAQFEYQLRTVRQVLSQINISGEIRNQIEKYYETLWEKKAGISFSSELYTLPMPLRMELMYDINVAHLYNSLLLRNQPSAFLRKLSLLMKHRLLLAGDILFHQGVVKDKIIFISKGVLEILSDEDDQSPIISFKSGSVLAEVSLLLSVPAKATVRAATYCEIQVILRESFVRMMLDHPDVMADLRAKIDERVEAATNSRNTIDKGSFIMNVLVSDIEEYRPIKILKRHLHGAEEEDVLYADGGDADTKIQFNTNYLSLYKLVPNVTMIERPKVCVSATFPWIFDPESSLIKFWNILVDHIAVVHCVMLTYVAVYKRKTGDFSKILEYSSDAIFVMDIIVRCCTAVILRNKVLKKLKAIVNYRMHYLTFYADCLSLFPVEGLVTAIVSNPKYQDRYNLLLKLNRLLRIWRLKRVVAVWVRCEDRFLQTYVTHSIYLIFCVYFVGAGLYLESCLFPVCTQNSWFYVKMIDAIRTQSIFGCFLYPITMSTYFATTVVLLIGSNDIFPFSLLDTNVVSVLLLMGFVIMYYWGAQLCASYQLKDTFRRSYQDNLNAFGGFLEQHNLTQSLYDRMINFFRVQWYYDRGIGTEFLINSAPVHLKSLVQDMQLSKSLKTIPLFQMVDMDFLSMVAEGATVLVLPREEVIAYNGDMNREMYIVLKGHCQMLNDYDNVVATYGPGAHFGALEMIFGIPKRYTTRTITNCKLIAVSYRTYIQAIAMFPERHEEVNNVIKDPELSEWVKSIDNNRVHVKEAKHKPKRAKRFIGWCHGLWMKSFIPVYKKCRLSKGADRYWKPFEAMHRYQYLGYLLMPIAIHPTGPFIHIWMFFRVIFVLVAVLVVPLYIAVIPKAHYLYGILLLARVSAYVEVYLLLHVGYYNKEGILITHPKYTAKHYLTHSFILDLLGIIPFEWIVKWQNSQHNEGHAYLTDYISPHVNHCAWHFNIFVQCHRIFEMFRYYEADIMRNLQSMRFFKMVVISTIIVSLMSSIIFHLTCTFEFEETQKDYEPELTVLHPGTGVTYYGYLTCTNGSWIHRSSIGQKYIVNNKQVSWNVFLIAVFWVATSFMSIQLGDISPFTYESLILIILILIVGRIFFSYVVASMGIGRAEFRSSLCKYQEKLQDFMAYLKEESVDRHWKYKTYHYLTYVWERTSGVQPQQLCSKLNTALKEDIVVFLYEKTLREVPLFENVEKSFIRVIAKHLTQSYFLKGDTVIRCFDVQNNIYIIHRGKVEVLSSYNEMIACMGPGGLFGNIRQSSPACSSVSIVATRNVDALVISSATFFSVIKDYPKVNRNMNTLLETVTDYIVPTSIANDDEDIGADMYSVSEPSAQTNISSGGTDSQMTPRKSFGSVSGTSQQFDPRIDTWRAVMVALKIFLPHKWFRFVILPENIFVRVVDKLILIVAYVDVLSILFCFVTQTRNYAMIITIMALEIIFYFKIFLYFHVSYMDRQGNYVSKCKTILKHYFHDYLRVFWDVIPNLPVEPFFLCFPKEHHLLALHCLRMLHVLRFYYIIQHFYQISKKLMTNLTFNGVLKMLAIATINAHIIVCGWILISCPLGNCLPGTWSSRLNASEQTPGNLYTVAFYYIISVASTTGIADVYLCSLSELAYTIIVSFLSRILTALFIGDLVTIVIGSTRSLVEYEYKIRCLRDFLKNQNLSNHQMDKFWQYICKLWAQQKGQHTPYMLKEIPYVMRCDLMTVMYGHHFRNSVLFHGIHEALLRQLTDCLERTIFFQGNYIVQNGDINQNMYFIHKGEVSVLTIHPNLTETQHDVLVTREMFGLVQGLYHGIPHSFSYRANTQVTILTLNLDSWYYMLKFFPGDRRLIYNRAQTVYVQL